MKTKILTLAAAAMLALSACDSDWEPKPDSGIQGKLNLASLGVEVDTQEEVVNPLAKADGVDVSGFIVKIYKADGEAPVQQWTYSQMPEIFSLPVGDYRVDVMSHEVQKQDWDCPLYLGSATFSITDSQITDIGVVTCKFSSIKVTVRFTDELRAAMGDDVRVVVVANDEGRLEWTPAETRVGCFEAVEGSTTLAARFTGSVKGYQEDIHRVYEDVKAGQHRIITFGLRDSQQEPDPETGMIDPNEGINVSVDVRDENVSGSVDNTEDNESGDDRPGKEDFKDPDDPDNPDNPDDPDESKVTFACPLDLSQEYPLTDENCAKAIIDITSVYPIASLVVDIDSSNDDFNNTLTMAGLGTRFDLANPADATLESTLAGFGLPVSGEVKGQTSVKFDVSGLVGMLGTFDGTHHFNVIVTDDKGKTFTTALKFKV